MYARMRSVRINTFIPCTRSSVIPELLSEIRSKDSSMATRFETNRCLKYQTPRQRCFGRTTAKGSIRKIRFCSTFTSAIPPFSRVGIGLCAGLEEEGKPFLPCSGHFRRKGHFWNRINEENLAFEQHIFNRALKPKERAPWPMAMAYCEACTCIVHYCLICIVW